MEAAMDTLKDKMEFQVRWQPFLLRPDMPAEGMPKPPQYSDPNNPRVVALKQAGKAVGLDFTGKAEMFPNTIASHALLEHTGEKYGPGKQNELVEVIFKAYFTDGIIPNPDNLSQLAEQVGLDKEEAKSVASDQTNIDKAKEKAMKAAMKGCSGVPLFYMNGQRIFSGAQEPAAFVSMFELVAERFPIEAKPGANI